VMTPQPRVRSPASSSSTDSLTASTITPLKSCDFPCGR
jgi:hypothetical protein